MSEALSKRKTKTEAHSMIYVKGQSHQFTFDELRKKTVLSAQDLADVIAGVPSQKQYQERKPFWIALIIVLGIVILLRCLGILALLTEINIAPPIIAFAVIIGIVVPAAGIFAAVKARVDWFRWIGFMLLYGILRNLTRGSIGDDVSQYIVLGFFGIAGLGTLYLPSLFKTKYKKSVKSIEADGKVKKELQFIFEEQGTINDDELLDTL